MKENLVKPPIFYKTTLYILEPEPNPYIQLYGNKSGSQM